MSPWPHDFTTNNTGLCDWVLTCNQVAAHSRIGTLLTAIAMETNLPSSAMRLSSAWLPWRLKRAANISWRTASRLCSWKQLHMISNSWSSWRALILWKKKQNKKTHLSYWLISFVCLHIIHWCLSILGSQFTLAVVFLSLGACRMNSSTSSRVFESTWGGCLPDCTRLQM